MQKTKFVPEADVVIQFKAFSEIPAVKIDGVVYVAFPMPIFGNDETKDDMDIALAKGGKKDETKSTKVEEVVNSKSFSEDELMGMETKELEKLCKSMGINPDDTEGKNTNKKLRLLILDAQKGSKKQAAPKEVEEKEEKPAKKSSSKEDDLSSKIKNVLVDLDKSKMDEDDAIDELVKLGGSQKQMRKFVDKFLGDADGAISDYVEECVELLGGSIDADDEKPTKKESGKKSKELTADDFEEGDEVEVYWANEDEWFKGKVVAIKGDSLKVKYEDDGSVSWSEEDDKFRKP